MFKNQKNKIMKISNLLFIVLMLLTVSFTYAQQRSKLPRVKVKAQKVETDKQSLTLIKDNATITAFETSDEANELTAFNNEYVNAERSVANADPVEKRYVVKINENNKNSSSHNLFDFQKALSKKIASPLLKIKSVEKTSAELWAILMISFYVLSVIFLVLMLLFLLGSTPNFTLFLVFLVLSAVFASAASLMLSLGRMGVF
jgi:hypothetical protein